MVSRALHFSFDGYFLIFQRHLFSLTLVKSQKSATFLLCFYDFLCLFFKNDFRSQQVHGIRLKACLSIHIAFTLVLYLQGKSKARRVKTIYDCQADNDDELTFVEGEVIIVTGEEDQEWWVSQASILHEYYHEDTFTSNNPKFIFVIL